MRKSIVLLGSTAAMLAAPFIANAQSSTYTVSSGIVGLIRFANSALNDIIILLITCAIAAFFWGLVRYIFNKSNTEERSDGLNTMIYGIIAIFVMVSIWGIIHVLQSTFGVSSTDQAQAPQSLQVP